MYNLSIPPSGIFVRFGSIKIGKFGLSTETVTVRYVAQLCVVYLLDLQLAPLGQGFPALGPVDSASPLGCMAVTPMHPLHVIPYDDRMTIRMARLIPACYSHRGSQPDDRPLPMQGYARPLADLCMQLVRGMVIATAEDSSDGLDGKS